MNGDIKLVIWDLDDTFWNGTISEVEITVNESNILILKTLIDRGIMNSICSKNDYKVVYKKLLELNIFDLFIFPSIDWTPKGSRIANIINNCQFRAENCIFVDDSDINLQETLFHNPGLNISTPNILGELLMLPELQGKNDQKHERLVQYKMLEVKKREMENILDNTAFLFQSDIECCIVTDCIPEIDRVLELINRTNQLNFTKIRLQKDELLSILKDKENIDTGYVIVKDKYGEHGIVGFYAIRNHIAEHFLFSCRVMGMGIEQWVYAYLGFPILKPIGECSITLNSNDFPEWVNKVKAQGNDINGSISKKVEKQPNVLGTVHTKTFMVKCRNENHKRAV